MSFPLMTDKKKVIEISCSVKNQKPVPNMVVKPVDYLTFGLHPRRSKVYIKRIGNLHLAHYTVYTCTDVSKNQNNYVDVCM